MVWQDDQKLLELVYSLDMAQVEGIFTTEEGKEDDKILSSSQSCGSGSAFLPGSGSRRENLRSKKLKNAVKWFIIVIFLLK